MSNKLNKKGKVCYRPGNYFDIIAQKKPLPGDSWEVVQQHYRGELLYLEKQLTALNVLDDAREIALICKKIIDIKHTLAVINGR